MNETTNYRLTLCDDATKRFEDWRKEINGTDNSNMIKIDNALGNKADSSVSIDAILYADAWTGSDSPFTQEIEIDGLTAAHNGTISVAYSATIEQRDIAREALLAVTGQEDGRLIISADGELPSSDIPVVIILLG